MCPAERKIITIITTSVYKTVYRKSSSDEKKKCLYYSSFCSSGSSSFVRNSFLSCCYSWYFSSLSFGRDESRGEDWMEGMWLDPPGSQIISGGWKRQQVLVYNDKGEVSTSVNFIRGWIGLKPLSANIVWVSGLAKMLDFRSHWSLSSSKISDSPVPWIRPQKNRKPVHLTSHLCVLVLHSLTSDSLERDKKL